MVFEKITAENFQEVCKELFKRKQEHQQISEEEKKASKHFEELKMRVLTYMEEHEKEKEHVKGFGLVYTIDRFTVPTPKTIEDKKALGKNLQKRGIFWEMFSVNSQTLNSFYKTEMEAAIARGEKDFSLPGIAEPTYVKNIGLRKE